MKILHDPVVMHEWRVFFRDRKIRKAHHLFAGVDDSRLVNRAVAFFISVIPQASDGVFLFEAHGLQTFVFAAFHASKATSSSSDYCHSHLKAS